jgi:hypothetical protein
MSAAWIIKAIDIFEDSQFSSTACVPSISPYQFSLDSIEECFHCCIVIAITLS